MDEVALQAFLPRHSRRSTGSSTSKRRGRQEVQKLGGKNWKLRARIEGLEQKGGEGAQGGLGFPFRRESGMEEEWRMDMDLEDEVESRRKLEEQKRKLHEHCGILKKVLVCAEKVSGKPRE